MLQALFHLLLNDNLQYVEKMEIEMVRLWGIVKKADATHCKAMAVAREPQGYIDNNTENGSKWINLT